jgi:hypothetical protein
LKQLEFELLILKYLKMKKLNKLHINTEKLMKNDELLTLRGGYDGPCTCMCAVYDVEHLLGYLLSESGNCFEDCRYAFGYPAAGWCT